MHLVYTLYLQLKCMLMYILANVHLSLYVGVCEGGTQGQGFFLFKCL